MRIVLIDFISLDGVVQSPGGPDEDPSGGFDHGGWSMPFFDPDTMGPAIATAMDTTNALLFGRRTWSAMAAAWPGRAGDPFADQMNAIQKYVVSETLTENDLTWSNSVLIRPDDMLDRVQHLRVQPGGDVLVWGSSQLARSLISHGLIDEYMLMIEPVLLGGGKRLFPDDGSQRPLELVETSVSATGVLICRYQPRNPAPE